MGKVATPTRNLSQGEQRALASFLAGRLPAGQLHDELCRAREAAVARAVAHSALGVPAAATAPPPAAPAPAVSHALHAA